MEFWWGTLQCLRGRVGLWPWPSKALSQGGFWLALYALMTALSIYFVMQGLVACLPHCCSLASSWLAWRLWHAPARADGAYPARPWSGAPVEAAGAHRMSAGLRLAVLFHRIGPYHLARLAAAGARCAATALELSAVDDTYAWSRVDGAPNFERVTLFPDEDVDRKSRSEVGRSVHRRSRRPILTSSRSPAGRSPARSRRCSGACATGARRC